MERSDRDSRNDIARLFQVISLLDTYDLSVTSCRIILRCALQTWNSESPSLSTPVDMSNFLQMHISSVNRAMLKLAEPAFEGGALLQRSYGPLGTRSEAYALSDRGRQFVRELLEAFTGLLAPTVQTQTIESYIKAALVKKIPVSRLSQIAWNPRKLELLVRPAEVAMSSEIDEWIGENLSIKTQRIQVGDEVFIYFVSEAEGMHFILRWC